MNYEEMHEYVCDAILDKDSIRYNNGHGSITPFFSNDLGDSVHEFSGQILSAYIHGNDQEILDVMRKLCAKEIDGIIDLVWG